MTDKQSLLTEHTYDGIQELDNPLPGWWKWTFVGSAVFSICYAMYFHIGAPGRSVADQYDNALAANLRLQFAEIGELTPDESTLVNYMHEPSWIKVGQGVFKTHCITCHGKKGEGKVGPNLTDDAYKNVRKIEDIARIIRKGAGNGAMPAWENRLLQNEIVLASSYVASLRGKNLPGRQAEGASIPAWPEPERKPATEATP